MQHDLPKNMRKRNLAIVLLDIIGSTAFVQRYGALQAAKLFQYHDKLTRSLIYKYDGREIDRSDGFLCSFDRPVDALNFALHYQRHVPLKTTLKCRIGIHWGTIIEVIQDDVYVGAGAKRVELEGISKNIAARTMSICGPGQVLLTKEAVQVVRQRTNKYTPHNTFYACAGLYLFKGVKTAQEIYMVAENVEYLVPPEGSDKVKRLGGPKEIRLRAKHRSFKQWARYIYKKLLLISYFIFIILIMHAITHEPTRKWFGYHEEFIWLDKFIQFVKDALEFAIYGRK